MKKIVIWGMNKLVFILIGIFVVSTFLVQAANYPSQLSSVQNVANVGVYPGNSPVISSQLPNCITDYQNACIKCEEGYQPINGVCQEDNCYTHDYYGACQSLKEYQEEIQHPDYNKIDSRKNIDRSQTSNCLVEINENCVQCREGYEPKKDICIKSECWTHDSNGDCLTLEEYNKKINSPNRSSVKTTITKEDIPTDLSDYHFSGDVTSKVTSTIGEKSGKVIFNSSDRVWLNTSLNNAKPTRTKRDILSVLADYNFSENLTSKITSPITGNVIQEEPKQNLLNKIISFFKNLI